MKTAPAIDLTTLEYLEKTFLDVMPKKGTDLRDIDFMIGQVSVVRHLRTIYDKQSLTILNKEK